MGREPPRVVRKKEIPKQLQPDELTLPDSAPMPERDSNQPEEPVPTAVTSMLVPVTKQPDRRVLNQVAPTPTRVNTQPNKPVSFQVAPTPEINDNQPGEHDLRQVTPTPPRVNNLPDELVPAAGATKMVRFAEQPNEQAPQGGAQTPAHAETDSSHYGRASADDLKNILASLDISPGYFTIPLYCHDCLVYRQELKEVKISVALVRKDYRRHSARAKASYDTLWRRAICALIDAKGELYDLGLRAKEHTQTHNLIAHSSGKGVVANPAPAITTTVASAKGKVVADNPAPASSKGAESSTSSASDVVKPDAAPASGKSATVDELSTDNTFADWLFDWLSNPSQCQTGRACGRKNRPSNRVAVPAKPSESGTGRAYRSRRWRPGSLASYQIPKRGQWTHSPIVYNMAYVSAPQQTQSTFGAGPSVPTPIPFASNGAVVGLNTSGQSATGGSIAQNDIGACIDIPAQHAGTSNGAVVGLNPAGQGSTGGSITRTSAPIATYTEYYLRLKTCAPSAVKRPRQQPSYISRRFVKVAAARLRNPANDYVYKEGDSDSCSAKS
ncbi:hypothetical protein GGI19_001516 [Coemansia pectinata]|uniref:Uncharacterized protein n=1 Tax=Coemansia pectinata TaxID=1052879 RepID=A0A9W8H1X4_9FUNG|nr:hypothetical protein GGI19_001516 [Coemansia pectinata]